MGALHQLPVSDGFFPQGGETGALIAAFDWSPTPLGPISAWPQSLKTALGLLLGSPVPMVMLWGEDGIMLYNDAYSVFAGKRHPQLLGSKVREGWPEVADFNDNVMRVGLAGGTLAYRNQELTLHRNGRPEQVWMDLAYSPVPDESGKPAGVLAVVVETTERVLAERGARTEREHLARLFEQAPGFIAMLEGPDHQFVLANAAYRDLVGRQELVGKTVRAALPEVEAQGFLDLLDQVYATGVPFRGDSIQIRLNREAGKPGEERFASFVYQPIIDDAGSITGIFVEGSDVSERVRADLALLASEARYRTLFKTIDAGFCIVEVIFSEDMTPVDHRFIEANPAFERQTGLRNAIGRNARDLIPDLEPHWFEIYGRVALTGEPVRFESGSDAMGRWFDVHALRVGEPQERRVAILFNDLTKRRRAEQRLRELNETLETQVAERTEERERTWRFSRDMFAIFDAGGILRRANPAWTAILDLRPDEVEGWHHSELTHPEDRNRGEEAFARIAQGATISAFEERYRHRDGSYRWISWTAAAPEGDLIFAVGRDITGDKEARAALQAAEAARREADALYRAYFENTAEALFVVGVSPAQDFWVEDLNPAHEAATGLRSSEVRGRPLAAYLPADAAAALAERYRRVIRERKPIGYRESVEGPTGRRHWDTLLVPVADIDGRISRIIGSARDITSQIQSEEKLRQAQKMEAVGQLTGGIAHDFNNLLGAVVGSLDLIRRKAEDVERVRRYAEAGLQAAERGAKLTGQLLAFSRAQRIELKPLVVSDLISEMRDLLASTLGPLIRLSFNLGGARRPVLSDPTQLEMAVLNLAINARDAMSGGGELTISTEVRTIGSDSELAPGDYFELSVADSGAGMPPEVAARAFEPFFTTKGIGKGTGLGLSQVYGIARQAGGVARIESRPGAGTVVRLYLPCIEAEFLESPEAAVVEQDLRAPTAAVLIIDDDADIRRVLVDTLDALGYRVFAADDGPSGLAAFDAHGPDAVVVDFAMPGMNGAEVARTLRQRRPDLPIVFASGYADTAAIENAVGPEAIVLRKPFRIDELQTVLAGALNR